MTRAGRKPGQGVGHDPLAELQTEKPIDIAHCQPFHGDSHSRIMPS